MGRTNLRWEPTAAGKGGAECVAAARLMRAIQEVISWAVLWAEREVCSLDHRVLAYPRPPAPVVSTATQLQKPEVLPLAEVADLCWWFFSPNRGKSGKAIEFVFT